MGPPDKREDDNDPAWGLSIRALTRVLFLSAGIAALTSPAAAGAWGATVNRHEAPINTEHNDIADSGNAGVCEPRATAHLPFTVSVDGEPMDGKGLGANADSQRCADLGLARADVQIRYDGLNPQPRLAVRGAPDAANRGAEVIFTTYTNYLTRVARGEIRIFAEGDTVRQEPIAIVPVAGDTSTWTVPPTRDASVTYVLRVYDHEGRFDETAPRPLMLADHRGGKGLTDELATVYDADELSVRNIPISGGAVTVSGKHVAPGSTVRVMGIDVPVDSKGSFAFRQILAPGPQNVRVEIKSDKGHVSEFSRSANIPDNDWFYVALADLTVGHGSSAGAREQLDPVKAGEYDGKTFVNGRLAFYLKGKIRGDVLLTASADTREGRVEDIASNFSSKDPHYLLRRLDPNKYYPVYGDDSTITEDAPTRGKFYVRLERGGSHIMWGNFRTSINGTEFIRYDRGLYGAKAHIESDASTSYGEKRAQAEVFGAEPGTSGARDVFRGTGGSLYYLRRQNITQGSERLSVELRDPGTGMVLKSKVLVSGEDYEINALQGRVLLRTPLASTADETFAVRDGSLSGEHQFLVVNYEYTAGLEQSEDRVAGGRASTWLGDHVQVGVSGYDQKEPGREQQLAGADVTVRYKPGTYVKAEIARSKGPGSGEAVSVDGGFTFAERGASGRTAYARRVEGAVDMGEVIPGAKGRMNAWWQERDEGFSAPGNLTPTRSNREYGIGSESPVSERLTLRSKSTTKEDEFRKNSASNIDLDWKLDNYWTITAGVRLDANTPFHDSHSPTLNQMGTRTDVGAKVTYDSGRDWLAYVFGQGTAARTGDRDRNNRGGVGGEVRVTEKLKANAEVSGGDGGLGGKIGTEYQVNDRSTAYLSYVLDTDRTDLMSRGGEGVFVTGARTRFSDNLSVYGEERYRHGGGIAGLTHAYGLDFVPLENWRMGLALENGTLTDAHAGDTERTAVSGTVGYATERINASSKLEFRDDVKTAAYGDIVKESERQTWLTANSLTVKTSEDWKLLGRLNASYSDASLGDFYDGDYLEGVAGFAYRPVNNDRLNALFKYTFFYDLPSAGQETPGGHGPDYAQRSHVLSADADYDVTKWLTLGGKYAFRTGELRQSRDADGEWFTSKADLVVGRANIHINKAWDVVGEARLLRADEAGDEKAGGLIAVYRHINENVMAGVGYNFSDFSDDLTDLDYDSRGIFFNVTGKF